MGNIFSIYNGLKKVCDRVVLINERNITDMRDADGIVIPGVGAFDDGVRHLKRFSDLLLTIVGSGVPLLGICIGMQLLFETSEEGEEAGLGLIPGRVVRLPPSLRVPHMGWNNLHLHRYSELLDGITESDYFYFVHSYYCAPRNDSDIIASVDYGIQLPAVVNRASIYGVQFHPEKSSRKGLRILANFVELCKC